MKKILLIGLLLPLFSICQADDPYTQMELKKLEEEKQDSIKNFQDSVVTTLGYVFKKGQTVKMGTGSNPDGTFKFIFISITSFFRYNGNAPNAANSENAMPAIYSGLNFEVLKIRKIGNKKLGYKYTLVLKNADLVRYEADFDNAIAAGEIIVPEEYRPKQKGLIVEVKNSFSVADEIIKLKKLLDEGVLTKEEFDAQKKKLLERKD